MKSLQNYLNEGLLGDDIRQLFRKQHVRTPGFIEKLVFPKPILIDWNRVFEKCWDKIVEMDYPCKVSVFWKNWGELIGILNERNIPQADFLTWITNVYVDKHAMADVVEFLFEQESVTYGIEDFIDTFEAETKRNR